MHIFKNNLNTLIWCCACRCRTLLGCCWWCHGMSWLGSQWCMDDQQFPCRGGKRTSSWTRHGEVPQRSAAQVKLAGSQRCARAGILRVTDGYWVQKVKNAPSIRTGKGCCVNKAQSNSWWRSVLLAAALLRLEMKGSARIPFHFSLWQSKH